MSSTCDVWGLLERGAAIDPGAPALITGSRPLDYASLLRTAALLGASLQAAGVQPGDRVAIVERNTPGFLLWTFACAGVGAILVPINLRLAAAEVAGVFADAEPKLVVAGVEFRELVDEALAGGRLRTRVAWMGPGEDAHPMGLPFDTAAGAAFQPRRAEPDEVCHLYYTSGTTGRAKGVPLTHRNVVDHALAATTELDLAADDVWGHIAPMFHLADAWATLAVTAVGGGHAFVPVFEAKAALGLVDTLGITVSNLVPTMLRRMLQEAPEMDFDGSSLRLILSGGAPIAPETVAAVIDVLRCEYVQTYGLTETSPYLTLSTLAPHHRQLDEAAQLARRARTGRAFETVELRVVDDAGDPVPADDTAVGEIIARGSTITPGYWNRPEETAKAFRDGWFHTGDLATIDDEGWVNIVDRKKDMILTGGENVYSIEVENALYSHPSVLECAAFGAPSEEWGEEVRAAVVLRPGSADAAGVSVDALRIHCRGVLAAYKVPRRIDLLEELPRTGSGKIAKRLIPR